MQGLMQNWPLRVSSIIDHAARYHGGREIVTRSLEGPIHRYTYTDLRRRAKRFASASSQLDLRPGDRVGTLAWNTYRHLETWYGLMGAGLVCHTLNPRLFRDQLAYIARHARDRYLLLDVGFVELAEELQDACPDIRGFVLLTDRAHMPATRLRGAVCYEELVEAGDPDFEWVPVDENAAAGLCYTSGTTGNPKGVAYSHRSNVLHALAVNGGDALGLRCTDSVLPVVPLYHANAWALAFSAPMAGAKLVLPGDRLDGQSLYELIEAEQVDFTAAVPTVWLALLEYLEQERLRLSSLRRVVIGGSAVPQVMLEKFERDYGVEVVHGWGMTEMSPLGTLATLKPELLDAEPEERLRTKLKQGRPIFSVDMKIVDDAGKELPWDGESFGHLWVRGPGVVDSYLGGEGGRILDDEGFFHTGDVATIDAQGYMHITDRSKDVIKSGGEWISSIELENAAVGHPDVAEAAVIGVAHAKWDERPLLIAVPREGRSPDPRDLLDFLRGKVARWWLPDAVVFVDEIPHTATGKIQKQALRERFEEFRLPEDSGD